MMQDASESGSECSQAKTPIAGEIMSEAVAQKMISIIANTKKIPVESITLDTTLEELKIDSLEGLRLFFELEKAFDITIPDDQAQNLRTVRQIVDGLENLLCGQGSAPSGTETKA